MDEYSLEAPPPEHGPEIAWLRDRLLVSPQDAVGMLHLAELLTEAGDLPGAVDLCQRALRVDPYQPAVAIRLGRLWTDLGDMDRSRSWFERALAIDPDNIEAKQRLAERTTVKLLPSTYVRALFDQFADTFDKQLVERLSYRAPALVADCLARNVGGRTNLNILDIGCGTGLSGLALQPFAAKLDGVDLSPRMLEKARARGVYSALYLNEVSDFLERSQAVWDVIAAVDMLVYVGHLDQIFGGAAARLNSGGLFFGTVEKRDEGGVSMTVKRRYAHGVDHIEATAQEAGFSVADCSEAVLRTEAGKPVDGLVFALRK